VSQLKNMRDTLAADLTVIGVPVFSSWPTSINLPCMYVMPPLGSVYLSAGPNFHEYTAYVDVAILVDHDDVETALETLETLLEAAITNSMDWGLGNVEPPAPIAVTEGGAEYLGIVMHLNKTFTL
jgi:hypothetical protein